jgi:hypothetical protein
MPVASTPPEVPQLVSDSAVVADIRHVDSTTLESWKRDTRVRWWIELGDQMLLVGDNNQLRSIVPKDSVRGELENIDPDRLRLRAVGCTHADDVEGRLLAKGGRWELREFIKGHAPQANPLAMDSHAGHWRNVEPNLELATRYRSDAQRAEPDPAIQPIVDSIDAPRWFADLSTLTTWNRSSYGTGLAQSRLWIEGKFNELGLEVSAPAFTMPGASSGQITVNNVIGKWTGTTFPNEWIVVGAHYDSRNTSLSSTTNTPGAEDNASGCAGVIELARAVLPYQPERTILFMCYAGEEQNLYGSKAHVTSLQSTSDLAKVKSVIIMDMIGYSTDANLDVLFESKSTWRPYLNRFAAAAATYVPSLGVTLSENPFGSDHMPYLNAGKETLLAIDLDYDRYPHYHRSTDTPTNMGPNAQAMGSAILKVNAAMLAEISGAFAPVVSDLIFQDSFESNTP